MKTGYHGFTLVELVIAMLVVAILAAIAIPSYLSYIKKGNRADAKQALVAAAQAMERYFTEQNTYQTATLGSAGIYPTASPAGYYTIGYLNKTQTSYTLKADPAGDQTSDACATFTLNEQGVQGVSGGSLAAASCW